jgi:hypothetical protein
MSAQHVAVIIGWRRSMQVDVQEKHEEQEQIESLPAESMGYFLA